MTELPTAPKVQFLSRLGNGMYCSNEGNNANKQLQMKCSSLQLFNKSLLSARTIPARRLLRPYRLFVGALFNPRDCIPGGNYYYNVLGIWLLRRLWVEASSPLRPNRTLSGPFVIERLSAFIWDPNSHLPG